LRSDPARARRYALASAVQAVAFVLAVLGPLPAPVAAALLLVAVLLGFWMFGHAQAELAFNAELDDVERQRWRIALACVPGALALYWLLWIR
jgi:hypothetical protein